MYFEIYSLLLAQVYWFRQELHSGKYTLKRIYFNSKLIDCNSFFGNRILYGLKLWTQRSMEVDGVRSLTVVSSYSWSTIISTVNRALLVSPCRLNLCIKRTNNIRCRNHSAFTPSYVPHADPYLLATLPREYQESSLKNEQTKLQNQLHICSNGMHK